MSDINLTELFANLSSSIIIPTSFHSQCSVVKKMLKDDSTGLINSLLQFQINAASVNFSIETDSLELSKILNKFLDNINLAYLGKIPSGINTIAKEYFTERWSASSLPVLKIAKWDTIGSLLLPSKMFIVDGSSIYAKDKDKKSEKSLLQYDYFLGKKMENRLDENVIFNRPFSRLWEKYTDLYLIRTGIFHNYKILASLKNKQGKILNQVIDYLFLIKRGSEILNRENYIKNPEDYTKILNQYGDIKKKAETKSGVPARVTAFDEQVEHLIPDLSRIFSPALFTVAEKAILGGMGFLDIAESVSSSRKESVLNPKPFQAEILAGVNSFKEMLRGVINLIKEKNKTNTKYMNMDIRVVNSPIMTFQTEEFKKMIRSIFKTGRVSSRTVIEICGELDYNTEKARILNEKKEKIGEKFYPEITENHEQHPDDKGNNIPKKIDKDNLPDDKVDPNEKKEYKIAKKVTLIGAPFRNLTELPENIRKLSLKKQQQFRAVWNKTYYWALGKGKTRKQAEKLAFRIAYSSIRPKQNKTNEK